jgi:hypothetical protein
MTLRNGGGYRSFVLTQLETRLLVLSEWVLSDVMWLRVQRRIWLELYSTYRVYQLHSGAAFKWNRVDLHA